MGCSQRILSCLTRELLSVLGRGDWDGAVLLVRLVICVGGSVGTHGWVVRGWGSKAVHKIGGIVVVNGLKTSPRTHRFDGNNDIAGVSITASRR